MCKNRTSLAFIRYQAKCPLRSEAFFSLANMAKPGVHMRNHSAMAVILSLVAASLVTAQPVNAQPTITTCTSGFIGQDIAINQANPHDAFIASSGSVVKHVSSVSPGSGPCSFGPLLSDIALGPGINFSWGVAIDNSRNLFVAAGSDVFTITDILQIAPPYTGPPTVFHSAGANFRSLAIHGNILYAADFCAGTILRFDLTVGPSSVTTFAAVPGVFGIFAAGVDDLFVTSNAGFTGCASGVGSNDVKHVTASGVSTVATGLSFPEGIGGDAVNLYIAAGAVVFTVPITGGTPIFYAGSPIAASHGVTVWKGGGYVTDSLPGEVLKFTLLGKCVPRLSGKKESEEVGSGTVTVTIRLTNAGCAPARNVTITRVVPYDVQGGGTLTYASPVLPISVGDLDAGASTTLTLVFDVSGTVTGFNLREIGRLQDVNGASFNFLIAQRI